MKLLAVIILAVCVTTLQSHQCGGKCCERGHSCVTSPKPICSPNGKEGDMCSLGADESGLYVFFPKCRTGLKCSPNTWTCVKKNARDAKCKFRTETFDNRPVIPKGEIRCGEFFCKPDECCVTYGTPHCERVRNLGEMCSAYQNCNGNYAFFCSCRQDLFCNVSSWKCDKMPNRKEIDTAVYVANSSGTIAQS